MGDEDYPLVALWCRLLLVAWCPLSAIHLGGQESAFHQLRQVFFRHARRKPVAGVVRLVLLLFSEVPDSGDGANSDDRSYSIHHLRQ